MSKLDNKFITENIKDYFDSDFLANEDTQKVIALTLQVVSCKSQLDNFNSRCDSIIKDLNHFYQVNGKIRVDSSFLCDELWRHLQGIEYQKVLVKMFDIYSNYYHFSEETLEKSIEKYYQRCEIKRKK